MYKLRLGFMDLRFGKKQIINLESRFKKICINEIKKYAGVLNGNGQLG